MYIVILFMSIGFLGYKIYETVNENMKKGICLYTNSILTKDELYKNAVYFYVNKSIEDAGDYYSKCKVEKICGVYYINNENGSIEEKVKNFNIDNSDFINLVKNKKNIYKIKVNSLYSRYHDGDGDLRIFTGIYTKAEKGNRWPMTSNANYYLGIRHFYVDENNNLKYTSVSLEPYFIPIDNCGKPLIF
ncbi:hypothetical protein GVX76_10420 [[Haemophilus] felis]|nr:hypothetical protein [[Haemophilus] felis]